MTDDRVNSPSHYTWLKDIAGVEVIDIVRHMGFNLGPERKKKNEGVILIKRFKTYLKLYGSLMITLTTF